MAAGLEKDTKEAAHYTPKAAVHNERCELCRYFIASAGQCRRVKGAISPKGWCRHFERA